MIHFDKKSGKKLSSRVNFLLILWTLEKQIFEDNWRNVIFDVA